MKNGRQLKMLRVNVILIRDLGPVVAQWIELLTSELEELSLIPGTWMFVVLKIVSYKCLVDMYHVIKYGKFCSDSVLD
jgi:hypothetical protein